MATDGSSSSERRKLKITIENVADNPELRSGLFETQEDTATALTFATVNVDNPSDELTLSVVQGYSPVKGRVEKQGEGWKYLPNANANGQDTWKMMASNSLGHSSQAVTMSMNITPVRDLPVARDVQVNGSEDQRIALIWMEQV